MRAGVPGGRIVELHHRPDVLDDGIPHQSPILTIVIPWGGRVGAESTPFLSHHCWALLSITLMDNESKNYAYRSLRGQAQVGGGAEGTAPWCGLLAPLLRGAQRPDGVKSGSTIGKLDEGRKRES